jgi:hypothetical protein
MSEHAYFTVSMADGHMQKKMAEAQCHRLARLASSSRKNEQCKDRQLPVPLVLGRLATYLGYSAT